MAHRTTQRTHRYWFRLILLTLIMLGIGALIVIFVVVPIHAADVMSYPPRLPVCCRTPADFGLRYEDVAFPTTDGLTLRGWYIPAQNGVVILFAHGGGSHRLGVGQLEQAAALAERGFAVLLFDQRDHGDSDGTQTSFTGADVLAALTYLRQRSAVDPDRIGAIGLSLGAISIVHAAAQDRSLKAIVLDGLGQSGMADLPPPTTAPELMLAVQRAVTFTILRGRGVVDPAAIESLSRMPARPRYSSPARIRIWSVKRCTATLPPPVNPRTSGRFPKARMPTPGRRARRPRSPTMVDVRHTLNIDHCISST